MKLVPAMIAAIGSLAVFSACTSNTKAPTATAPVPEATEVPPEGWNKVPGEDGIYWRWCPEGECSASSVIGDNRFVLAQVWCKERSCGDIYARVNLLDAQDVVVGWTNDTAYGAVGQKVQLTFDSHQDDWANAQITELNIRG